MAISLALSALIAARWARADEVEPPADVADGEDYAVEAADSLAEGDVEVGVGYAAREGGRAVRRRHARFRGDSLGIAVHDGAEDALAGSALEGAVGRGRFGLGRVSPQWGRGLVLGESLEPWSRRARAPRRRADGDIASYRVEQDGRSFGALCGSFGRRTRAGLELGAANFGAGCAGDRTGVVGTSVWWARADTSGTRGAELAFDRAGRWRFETALERDAGPARLAAWMRAGLARHRPIGDPRRAGPPHALSLSAELPFPAWSRAGAGGRARARTDEPQSDRGARRGASARRVEDGARTHARITARAALWDFGSGANGARAMLEVEHALPQHAAVIAGFEEQHGTRRDPQFAISRSSAYADVYRQGAWGEWRASSGPLALAWRHERWGAKSWVRDAVRVVSTARISVESSRGLGARVTYAVYRIQSGEHVYVPEAESDRLVLRALSGDGERTRVELNVPFAGGRVHGALNQTSSGARPPRRQWTLEWTRRAHAKRGA